MRLKNRSERKFSNSELLNTALQQRRALPSDDNLKFEGLRYFILQLNSIFELSLILFALSRLRALGRRLEEEEQSSAQKCDNMHFVPQFFTVLKVLD